MLSHPPDKSRPHDRPIGHARKLKSVSERPVCVGFGINKPEHVAQLAGVADGAIVGTAFVRRMTQHAADGPQAIAKACGDYCRELLSRVR